MFVPERCILNAFAYGLCPCVVRETVVLVSYENLGSVHGYRGAFGDEVILPDAIQRSTFAWIDHGAAYESSRLEVVNGERSNCNWSQPFETRFALMSSFDLQKRVCGSRTTVSKVCSSGLAQTTAIRMKTRCLPARTCTERAMRFTAEVERDSVTSRANGRLFYVNTCFFGELQIVWARPLLI